MKLGAQAGVPLPMRASKLARMAVLTRWLGWPAGAVPPCAERCGAIIITCCCCCCCRSALSARGFDPRMRAAAPSCDVAAGAECRACGSIVARCAGCCVGTRGVPATPETEAADGRSIVALWSRSASACVGLPLGEKPHGSPMAVACGRIGPAASATPLAEAEAAERWERCCCCCDCCICSCSPAALDPPAESAASRWAMWSLLKLLPGLRGGRLETPGSPPLRATGCGECGASGGDGQFVGEAGGEGRSPPAQGTTELGVRNSSGECAKKHTRRWQPRPSLHDCVRYREGWSQHSNTP
mmetsp:Transcript_31079/g.101290  ORF Transcript_31079/g.101290 Transcript_31079/m.101290 type:complete len:299 (+) Transcript_31079:295-1191(+)